MIEKAVLQSFYGKSVLVTGGTGLIGRQVVDILDATGARVRIVSLDKIKVSDRAEHILGDLTSFEFCRNITRDIDFVFHLAGIYTSSIGAYASAEIFKETENQEGPPMDMFPGWAKRMAELQIQAYQIQYGLNNFSIVRPCNVYGPGDNFDPNNAMVIPALMYRIYHKEDPVLIWGDGSAIRDFAYSRDVAEGVILALHYGTNSHFVNLGSGQGYSIKELVETLHSFIDFNYKFDTSKPAGFPKRVMDISLARKLIHYKPTTTLLDGLKQTWDWFTRNRDEYLNKINYFREPEHGSIKNKT
ncbi:MAG: NAD-dependent epimerase/dehydratase family protein [Chloroflexi bacterium]|nr:NAD-dependent epimerase/dehydratase family protein [Chloroflexota bacterium]